MTTIGIAGTLASRRGFKGSPAGAQRSGCPSPPALQQVGLGFKEQRLPLLRSSLEMPGHVKKTSGWIRNGVGKLAKWEI